MATKFQQGSATIDISLSDPEQYTLWTQKVTQRLVFEQSLVNPPATYCFLLLTSVTKSLQKLFILCKGHLGLPSSKMPPTTIYKHYRH